MNNEPFDQMSMTGFELEDLAKNTKGENDPQSIFVLYWIARRRDERDFTLKEAKSTSLRDAMDYLGLDNPLTQTK